MSVLVVCALIACVLPILAQSAARLGAEPARGYDNRHPGAQQHALTGFGARALAAHQNSFESLIIFAVALAVVIGANKQAAVMDTLAISYIICAGVVLSLLLV